jgi:hypothetical protein
MTIIENLADFYIDNYREERDISDFGYFENDKELYGILYSVAYNMILEKCDLEKYFGLKDEEVTRLFDRYDDIIRRLKIETLLSKTNENQKGV